MALEQYFTKEWESISADSETTYPCFDCNICLDFAHDPVVTLCGHLYCWPCIYKWFHFQSASLSSDEHPFCPVCKVEISHNTVVPLYGRGLSLSEPEPDVKAPHIGMIIPPRPPAWGLQTLMTTYTPGQSDTYRNPYPNPRYPRQPYNGHEEDSNSSSPPLLNLGDNTVMGMFGEMVYARVFGNSQSLYTYPNSYHLVGSSSPRLRRQEIEADKSLYRISVFLFCCLFLCLFLF